MRHLTFSTLLAFALACAAGCTRSNLSIDGDGGDCPGCGSDLAGHHDGGGHHDGAVDLSRPGRDLSQAPEDLSGPRTCVSTCSHCGSNGGACCPGAPNGCCASGEWCDNGKCRCGDHDGCTQGDICATGGPIGPGLNQCGAICCGATGPCPL